MMKFVCERIKLHEQALLLRQKQLGEEITNFQKAASMDNYGQMELCAEAISESKTIISLEEAILKELNAICGKEKV